MMAFTTTHDPISKLPEVDERLVVPEARYEIVDGRVVHVPPADEPHGANHCTLAAIAHAHRADAYAPAVDMLTRTSQIDDIAPDVSVYPSARDPATGGRLLEELAFEIVSTESIAHAGTKAAKLVARGVRRVFAIDLKRARALEWSKELGEWSLLDRRGQIEDPVLAVPIPIEALLDAARAGDAIPHALRVKRHPEFIAERAEGRAEGRAEALLVVLAARGLKPTEAERRRILEERELGRLERWLAASTSCADVAALLAVA